MIAENRQLELHFSAAPCPDVSRPVMPPGCPETSNAAQLAHRQPCPAVGDYVTLISDSATRVYKIIKVTPTHATCCPEDGKSSNRRVAFWKLRPYCAAHSLLAAPPAPAQCSHSDIHIGLDAAHCPGCNEEFKPWSKDYQFLLEVNRPLEDSQAKTRSGRHPARPLEDSQAKTRSGRHPARPLEDSQAKTPSSRHTPASGWIERYLVQGRWEHHRYCWQEKHKGKTHQLHIPRDSGKLLAVREGIREARTPKEIARLLKTSHSKGFRESF